MLIVKNWLPNHPGVGGLPNAAANRPKVKGGWISGDAGNCCNAPTAKRAD
jgi:hypothetical protein